MRCEALLEGRWRCTRETPHYGARHLTPNDTVFGPEDERDPHESWCAISDTKHSGYCQRPGPDTIFDVLARIESAVSALLALSPVSPLERVRAESPERHLSSTVTQYGWDNARHTQATDESERRWMESQRQQAQIAAVTRCGSEHQNIRIVRQCMACGVAVESRLNLA